MYWFSVCISLALAIWPLAGQAEACDGRLIDNERVFASPLCIPADPIRVVVLDHGFSLGIGMELGLPIVGAPLALLSDEALTSAAREASVVDIGMAGEPSLETVVALQPDLMIAATTDEGLVQSLHPILSSIAPTLVYTSADWRGYYELIASLTGREEQVAQDFTAFEERLADIRSRMPDTKVSIVRITSWDFQVSTDTIGMHAPFAVAARAGLKRSDWETEPDGPVLKRPDWEELANLDGDILFYIIGGTNRSDKNGRFEEVVSNPLWQMLPAVKAGRVHRVESSVWVEFRGLPSAHRILDDLENYVIGP